MSLLAIPTGKFIIVCVVLGEVQEKALYVGISESGMKWTGKWNVAVVYSSNPLTNVVRKRMNGKSNTVIFHNRAL